MHFSFVRLYAAGRSLTGSNLKGESVVLPRILQNRHYVAVRPLVMAYLRSQESGERVRALSALTSVVRNLKDPVALEGIEPVFHILGASEEEVSTLLQERSASAGAMEQNPEDEETLGDVVEYNISSLRRIKAVYNGKNTAAEFETLKNKSVRHVAALTEIVDSLSPDDFDRMLHGLLKVHNRAMEYDAVDRLVEAIKKRMLEHSDELQGHTISRFLYLLFEVGDKNEEFRTDIAPQITRTLSTWTFRETVLGFHSLILSARFDDPPLFGAMLDHMKAKSVTATTPQIIYLMKLMKKNEIRHTELLKALADRSRVLLHVYSIDEIMDLVEAMLELAFDCGDLLSLVMDNFTSLLTIRSLAWFHVSRMTLILERIDESTPGRAELSFALGRFILKSIRSVKEETLDIVRSLCWEYRKM